MSPNKRIVLREKCVWICLQSSVITILRYRYRYIAGSGGAGDQWPFAQHVANVTKSAQTLTP